MQRLGAVGDGQVGPDPFVEATPRLGNGPLDFGKGVAVTSPTWVSSAGFSTLTTSSPVTH